MAEMVHGTSDVSQSERHADSMVERGRKDFHHEFTTLRFRSLGEYGNGTAEVTTSQPFRSSGRAASSLVAPKLDSERIQPGELNCLMLRIALCSLHVQ